MASQSTDSNDLAAYGADTIAKGSKSFAMASLLFEPSMRENAQLLYAWCRYCDDVIDGQDLGDDAPDPSIDQAAHRERLKVLRYHTERSIAGEDVSIPAFQAFGSVIRTTRIPHRFPFALLDGFAMDVERQEITTDEDLMQYCYGVAGVVGVMMAIIMGVEPNDEETLERACDLGLAFQLTNICRDVIDDARGSRVYLPSHRLKDVGVSPTPESIMKPENRTAVFEVAADLLALADSYYLSATQGVKRLPLRAGAAILAARDIYKAIGEKLLSEGPKAWDERISISSTRKAGYAARAFFSIGGRMFENRNAQFSPRPNLWSGPIGSEHR